jgi:hypothetical protein
MDEEYNNVAKNSAIIIAYIIAIIYAIPGILWCILYLYYRNTDLLSIYLGRQYDLNMQYGILKDILLLSTYIPSKHPEFCDDEWSAVAKEERIFIELRKDEIKKIIKKIKEIKGGYEKDYKNIQKESYEKVEQNLKIREAREEKDRLLKEAEAGKDSRHNSTSTRLWIQNVGSAIQTTFVNILNIAIFAKDIFISIFPLFKAIIQNKVIMGFLIIVFLIILMLYSLKPSSSNNKNGGNAKTNSMSTFSPYTIYIDVIDSYKHYSKMAKDLSNTMSNTLSNNEEGKDQEIIDDTIYDRELHDPKKKKGRYDNLSYINLGEIGITTQEFTIEKDKYYNINLPSSKFQITNPNIKWKTYEKDVEHKGEIKWKIDCEKIDTVKDDTSPAFITDTDDDNKCIINVRGFDNKKKSSADNEEDAKVYSTEEIKYE